MGKKVFQVVNDLLLLGITFVTLYPFLYVVFASISDPVKMMTTTDMIFYPQGFSLKAYKSVFANPNIYMGYANTFFLSFQRGLTLN